MGTYFSVFFYKFRTTHTCMHMRMGINMQVSMY